MKSEHEAPASDYIDQLINVVRHVREEGGLFEGSESDIASLANRRWRSFERRHKNANCPTHEERVRDLMKGLAPKDDPDWLHTHPAEIQHLAEQLAGVLSQSDQI